MSEVTIFKNKNAVSTRREPTALAQSLLSANNTTRRIQTNTNGTFRRLINGEQMGDAVRGEINVIIVAAQPKVSRVFYKGKYDPDAKPTLPDCWSNAGDAPEKEASNKQSATCNNCQQNVVGSGENGKGRACRYQRRVALLLEGDNSGEIYQFKIPAKSLFGKGTGNVHPFESYVRYLVSNHESPDTVVTNVSYDLNADSLELQFTPIRGLTDEEYDLVVAAQANPEAERYTKLTVAQVDGVTKKPNEPKEPKAEAPAKIERSDGPTDEDEAEVEEPKRRGRPKVEAEAPPAKRDLAAIIKEWGED